MKIAIRQKFVETQTMKVSFPVNISKTDNYTNYLQKFFKPRAIHVFGVNHSPVMVPLLIPLSRDVQPWGGLALTRHIIPFLP